MGNKELKGYGFMFGSVLASTITTLLSGLLFHLYPELSAYDGALWGSVGAVILGTPVFIWKRSARKRIRLCWQQKKKLALTCSLMTAFGAFLWWYVLHESNVGIVALLGKSEILMSVLLGVFLLKERIRWISGLGLIVMTTGLLLISNLKGEVTAVVVGAALLSRVPYALQGFLVKRESENLDTVAFTFIRLWIIMLAFLIGFGVLGEVRLIPFDAMLLAGLSMIPHFFFGRIFQFKALKYADLSRLASIKLLQPILVVIGGFVFFNDPLSSQKIWGAGLIILGLWWFLRHKQKSA